MNWVVASITTRQLLGRRRVLLLAAMGALMVLVALVYRLGDPTAEEAHDWTIQLLTEFGVRGMLPIVALIIGTGAFGAEIDEGTIIHLLSKPTARFEIVISKLLPAVALTALMTVPATVVVALIGGSGDGASLAVGFGAGMLAGSVIYAAVFVMLGMLTSRAFIIGLAYIILWEGLLAGLFAGTRTFSVRQHVLGVTDAIVPISRVVGDVLEPTTALVVGALAVVLVTAIGIRALGGFEVRGEAV
jgi:ABC-2 type transport system permease protein